MDGSEVALDVLDRAFRVLRQDVSPDAKVGLPERDVVEVSLILVTHNSGDVLPDFLRSLAACPPTRSWELIVFDNASHDESVALLRHAFDRAQIIESGTNRGFAAAVNAGAERAHGRYYLLVNPDVSWQTGVIDRLIGCLENRPGAAAVTPRLVFPDGRPQPSLRRFPTHGNIWFSRGAPWSRMLSALIRRDPYTVFDPETAERIEAAAAACVLVRAAAFHAIGGMDEGYFLYVEDTDLCRRLTDAGWEIWIEPEARVVHRWGSNVRGDRLLRMYHRRGIRRYFRKFHGSKRIRNGILFLVLTLADAAGWIARLGAGRRR